MARFMASIHGRAGEASRLGNRISGISSHTRGWNIGIQVEGHVESLDDSDVFEVYATGGSNGGRGAYLGKLTSEGWYPSK